MDYFLTLPESDICSVLHKKSCLKFQQLKDTPYACVGYYWAEHEAAQKAMVIAQEAVVLCPTCMNENKKNYNEAIMLD
ncbi:hypothetical protein UA45_19840 [Morganella morganii]|uniref:Uncharacterized protein n=1 Tax=Morganella morganii TaxID=582 RepID=A0A0D8L4V2_MORMO|nr:hypothetical protein UA45_19840 [Morganella morganii]